MSEQVRPPVRPGSGPRVRARGWIALAMLLAFYVVGALRELPLPSAWIAGIGL